MLTKANQNKPNQPKPAKTKQNQISQFWPNFTILTKFHNFDQISQFWPNFTILDKTMQTMNAHSVDHTENADS